MASLLSGLRRAAPKLSREIFVCHRCISTSMKRASIATSSAQRINLASKIKYPSTIVRNKATSAPALEDNALNRLNQEAVSDATSTQGSTKSKRSFPDTSSRGVAYWLLGSAASVFGIVVFGGLTRLTESG